MSKVFISYARDGSYGENLAVEIQQQLLAAGFAVFRDVIGLKPGDVWYRTLEFELETSDVMVLVVSEKVRTSKWVHNEVSMAEEIGIPVIPVLAEKVRYPLWLRHLQSLDFCGAMDWSLLLGALGHHVGSGAVGVREIPVWANDVGQDEYGRYADLVVKGITQKFRWIEPGTFWMGSPESEPGRYDNEIRHQVTLTKGFWLADTTCTQFLWTAVLDNNPAHFTDDANNPVEGVSWNDTQTFLQKLNTRVAGLNPRLPTEAEWEYACRAGTNTSFSFGDNITSEQINYNGNYPYANGKKGLDRHKTVPVKSLPANAWGLHEMHGNVLEWCRDWYGDYPAEPVTNPEGSQAGVERVVRGGSWHFHGGGVRSAIRRRLDPALRYDFIGFRLALGL
ncbi:SUMF1/EgtB/PvdO family nonheme iron enzyme [Thiothrix fructosivorans]|uniref:SUMF1/EgtB/PvdO family nonheme iron enzyme n=1 Tax=Thiothrix fructosivorans TaxID=111770 RepID=A0A8B0SMC3_9GAMM|nr:SUMF1/EgtB/PvdO family nonheme iron enzyme [Thiothrix fructosivorans]MBO0612303.1 SUMF1/EgtB/PvdO family nonheme iron enzyme [Thiothrix fructosivorans]QTX12211.1 SUMF1/EgtB/PvdO family nonheme iron enzyme [Thiothrix fructosivorans]